MVLSAISAVLLTRTYLVLTGYPKVGGGHLHIAHVLWGGLLMLLGLGVALVFLGRAARMWAATLGGAGFGLFIDEVGKFVTDEPGYFYRPAAGIIYLCLSALAVVTHWLRSKPTFSEAERAASAADFVLSGVISGLSPTERENALRLLEGSDREIDRKLTQLLIAMPERASVAPRWPRTLLIRARELVDRLADSRWLPGIAVTYLIGQVLLPLAALAGSRVFGPSPLQGWLPLAGMAIDDTSSALSTGQEVGAVVAAGLCALVAAALTVAGAFRLRRDRLTAFRLFSAALLTDILLGQIFTFTVNQFSAVFGVAVSLFLLWVVSVEIRRLRPLRSRR